MFFMQKLKRFTMLINFLYNILQCKYIICNVFMYFVAIDNVINK
jgi:hypothetical protein